MHASAPEIPLHVSEGHEYVDITNEDPQPQPGWHYIDDTWIPSADAVRDKMFMEDLVDAHEQNETYLALENHNPPGVEAQVNALTEQVNMLIYRILNP